MVHKSVKASRLGCRCMCHFSLLFWILCVQCRAPIHTEVSWGGSFSQKIELANPTQLSQLYLSRLSLVKPAKLNFFKTPHLRVADKSLYS
jgi:hypothetical protein